eukprot:2222886-Prymnesium_polylepis.2
MDGATDLAKALGAMQLDWLSTDEYYDVALADYRATYRERLYPHLRPEQRVVIVLFIAYCELNCAANASLVPAADARCLGAAQGHVKWFNEDDRVVGL